MLGHQLPAIPPIDAVLDRLDAVLSWLDRPVDVPAGTEARPGLPSLGRLAAGSVIAPPSVTFWGSGAIEQVRFAGANRLLVSFTYSGKPRVAEPYSLRRTSAGFVTLFAWVRGDANIKQFRIDEIRGLTVTSETFEPRYAIELTGPMVPSSKRSAPARRTSGSRIRSGGTYIYRCDRCGREFSHERSNPALRPHQDTAGSDCSGRRGNLERVE
jgi:DNA-directed RNA polymerase subunit RPC12/RpoP